MAASQDTEDRFQQYAHPQTLVSTEWLSAHLDDPTVVVVESDEDVLLYETGHIPGAIKIDWHMDLNDPVTRDYIDAEAATTTTGGPHMRSGCSRSSATPTCGSWTGVVRSGSPRGGAWTRRRRLGPRRTIQSSSDATVRFEPSATK